ncbi:hypothetical protein [Planctomycetes bacterium K23_9]|uniref:Uncharacterized protein n=1 Tax=Stieleria marina TaxID=1930275 RepID=A0A517NUD3_9BACT|nr:hypothetical protein K239x_26900 [Planctomycetes bacterium K23_9]
MIRIRTRVRFDSGQVKKKVNTANFRSLGQAAGAIRLTAKRSIRKRKKSSSPGSPPHTQTGMLRRVLRYEVDRVREQAFIGPVNEIAGRLWNLHEFGGIVTKRRKLKRHRFRVGQHGPIRAKQPGKFARVLLLTAAQAHRATRLIEEENERRGATKPRRYPKRPFMKPALAANQARLPKFWRDSVK